MDVRKQFGSNAKYYVDSKVHPGGVASHQLPHRGCAGGCK